MTLGHPTGQVARELLPKQPSAALSLFETFNEADAIWFDHADDSAAVIGEVMHKACQDRLKAAAGCDAPPAGWPERLYRLHEGDRYVAREDLLRRADLLLDEAKQRKLVAHFESQLAQARRTDSPRIAQPVPSQP